MINSHTNVTLCITYRVITLNVVQRVTFLFLDISKVSMYISDDNMNLKVFHESE